MLPKGAGTARTALEEAWRRQTDLPARIVQVTGDAGALATASLTVLRCLEDKEQRGAFVAAPGAPWGEINQDGNHVYDMVWSRDLYQVATALIDVGDTDPANRGLRHLANVQRADGSWPQNWTPAGRPHWNGTELDEAAYPILLARRLWAAGTLDWDPYPQLVRRAAGYIVRNGPLTPLDRWEDGGGLSPSTLAAAVSALVSAAEFANAAGEHLAAAHFLAVADYWADRVEPWCFSPEKGHYVRLASDPDEGAGPNDVLSTDFLELVRLGVRGADHPAVLQSLHAVDAQLLFRGPGGPAWRRYVGDGYGELADGSSWRAGGIGRPWPLLAGERAQYEFLAGGNRAPDLARAYESFAGPGLMLPEQVWDGPPVPARGLVPGKATGSAAPLGWAHAEYLKLLCTIANQRCGDLLPAVGRRYTEPPDEPDFVWSAAHPIQWFERGRKVRVQLAEPATLRWSADEWASFKESVTSDTTLGLHVATLPTQIMRPGAVMSWTIHYVDRWEGRNYTFTCR